MASPLFPSRYPPAEGGVRSTTKTARQAAPAASTWGAREEDTIRIKLLVSAALILLTSPASLGRILFQLPWFSFFSLDSPANPRWSSQVPLLGFLLFSSLAFLPGDFFSSKGFG